LVADDVDEDEEESCGIAGFVGCAYITPLKESLGEENSCDCGVSTDYQEISNFSTGAVKIGGVIRSIVRRPT